MYSLVSLENVLLDVKEMQRGMDLTRREYSMHGHNTMLKDFIQQNENKLKKLQDDAKIAQVPLTLHTHDPKHGSLNLSDSHLKSSYREDLRFLYLLKLNSLLYEEILL